MERMELRRFNLSSPPDRDPDPKVDEGQNSAGHLSAEDMKHRFAVQPLNESTLGSRREFLCHCIRCKWTFQVSPESGWIVAFNNVAEPLAGAEATRRIATFAEGPCPAFADFPEYEEACREHKHHAIHHAIRDKLHRLTIRARFLQAE